MSRHLQQLLGPMTILILELCGVIMFGGMWSSFHMCMHKQYFSPKVWCYLVFWASFNFKLTFNFKLINGWSWWSINWINHFYQVFLNHFYQVFMRSMRSPFEKSTFSKKNINDIIWRGTDSQLLPRIDFEINIFHVVLFWLVCFGWVYRDFGFRCGSG